MIREALVVGINNYDCLEGVSPQERNLETPAKDAEEMAQRLAQICGFAPVRRLPSNQAHQVNKDGTVKAEKLREAIRNLFNPDINSTTQRAHVALFYFAGHGLKKRNEVYLATSDADGSKILGVSLQDIIKILDGSPEGQQQILWLDCCYSGAIEGLLEKSRKGKRQKHSRFIIASAREGEPAYVSTTTGEHAALTEVLLKGLDISRSPYRRITDRTLISFIKDKDNFKGVPQYPVTIEAKTEILLTPNLPKLRIFVASAEDLLHERDRLNRVVEQLKQQNWGKFLEIKLIDGRRADQLPVENGDIFVGIFSPGFSYREEEVLKKACSLRNESKSGWPKVVLYCHTHYVNRFLGNLDNQARDARSKFSALFVPAVEGQVNQYSQLEQFEQRVGDDLEDCFQKFAQVNGLLQPAGVSQPGTLPLPDAGLDQLTIITQKPAFSQNVEELKWVPFDTGTVWGLERGSFIGILAGCQGDGVYENLISVERELFNAIDKGNLSLPTRWWIRIAPGRYPNGPHNAAEVWDSAVEPDNPKVKWLKTQGLPDSIIPGIFFEFNFQDLLPTRDVIKCWCEALLQNIFPDRQLATVINLKGMDKNLKPDLLYLHKHLSEGLSGILIEAMILKDWYTVRYKEGTVERAQDEPFAAPKPVGFHFCSWVYKASAGRKELGRREEQEKYRSVIDNYQKFRSPFSGDLPVSSALKVVSDLDEIAGLGDKTIYRQFLEFIENYLPGRLYELVSAYPESSSRQARREALIFARSHEDIIISDLLMDAWVEGSQFKQDRFPQGNELTPLPGNKPFVNDLTWAILRQARKSREPQVVDSLIQKMKPNIPQPVINFCLGKPEKLAKEAEIIEAAIRGEAKLDLALDKFKTDGLRRPVFAKLLAAMPPSPEGLVKLNKAQRAVFGLCVAQDWKEIEGDVEIFEKILDSRRGRMLG